jgi:hypothetical protein
MIATLERAFGYQGDAMNLPVADVDAAVTFYERFSDSKSNPAMTRRLGRWSSPAIRRTE